MRNADLVHIIDQDLKSVDNVASTWRELFDRIPKLVEVMNATYLPHPADCPSQSQLKKLMFAIDRGEYAETFSSEEKSAILNLVPFVGPLHISLNGIQDLIVQSRYEKIHCHH